MRERGRSVESRRRRRRWWSDCCTTSRRSASATLATMLSPVEVARYQRDGYVVPDFRLPLDTIEAIKADHAGLIARHPEFSDYCSSLLVHDLCFLNYARNPALLDLVAQLIGPDLALWNSSLFAKPARVGTRTPWHQDGEYWPIRPLATCTVWIALDASTRENGCLRFLPGSHRSRTLASHHHNDAAGNALPLEPGTPSTSTSRKRSTSSWNRARSRCTTPYLMHGSEPNRSGRPRRGMTLRFMPTSSVYHHDLRNNEVDAQRTVFLMRGTDRSGRNDFRLR